MASYLKNFFLRIFLFLLLELSISHCSLWHFRIISILNFLFFFLWKIPKTNNNFVHWSYKNKHYKIAALFSLVIQFFYCRYYLFFCKFIITIVGLVLFKWYAKPRMLWIRCANSNTFGVAGTVENYRWTMPDQPILFQKW